MTTMKKTRILAFAVAAVLGAAIWAASPLLVKEAEPWDADEGLNFLYYPAALLSVGLICGLFVKSAHLAIYAGLLAGQIVYMFSFLPSGPLIVLGLIYLAAISILAVVGSVIAQVIVQRR